MSPAKPAALRLPGVRAERSLDPELVEKTVAALAEDTDSALARAARQGLPERAGVASWIDRCTRLVLLQHERAALRSEVPQLGLRLAELLETVTLEPGQEPRAIAEAFLVRLPAIRERLTEDVEAAYRGDPAARGHGEVVAAYPAVRAIAVHRISHELFGLRVPILPRMMSEHAHQLTGIDIHPGATIGRRFFIDHGTGVVVGETTEIGDDVQLYQGVTLGALSPRHGESQRGRKRHPTIEDEVTIYAGTTILGGATVIGRGSVIGGNVWLTESIPAGSRVIAEPPRHGVSPRRDGGKGEQLAWLDED